MDVIDGLIVKKMSLLSALSHLIKVELKFEFSSLLVYRLYDTAAYFAIFQKRIQHFLGCFDGYSLWVSAFSG